MIGGFISVSAHAQILKPEIIKKKTGQAPPPPPPSTQQPAPVYSLTGARVTLRTGTDNKEFPSQVTVYLIVKGSGYIYWQPGENLRNEMRSNSTNEFGLDKWPYGGVGSYALSELQKNGLILLIYYYPNFLTDAWKVAGISVTIEVKDQYGNLHPSLGNKTITFNASGFLNLSDRYFECRADGNFEPVIASIKDKVSGIY